MKLVSDKYWMKLLFVPLDIEVTQTNFDLGEQYTYHQNFWETKKVLGKENNYQQYRSLLDQIPIVDITTFTHKVQQIEVAQHYDYYPGDTPSDEYKHIVQHEPAGYHIVLNGKCDSLEIHNGKEWLNPILPKAPIAYLLSLTSCLHRVKKDHLRQTLYIKGFLDIEKHNQLIERSLKRYGDIAIYQQ
jgi:hypothetical protein